MLSRHSLARSLLCSRRGFVRIKRGRVGGLAYRVGVGGEQGRAAAALPLAVLVVVCEGLGGGHDCGDRNPTLDAKRRCWGLYSRNRWREGNGVGSEVGYESVDTSVWVGLVRLVVGPRVVCQMVC